MSEQKITSGLYTRSEEIPDERFVSSAPNAGIPFWDSPI